MRVIRTSSVRGAGTGTAGAKAETRDTGATGEKRQATATSLRLKPPTPVLRLNPIPEIYEALEGARSGTFMVMGRHRRLNKAAVSAEIALTCLSASAAERFFGPFLRKAPGCRPCQEPVRFKYYLGGEQH